MLGRRDGVALACQPGRDEGLAGGPAQADLRRLRLQRCIEIRRQGQDHLALAARGDERRDVEPRPLHHLGDGDGELAELGRQVDSRRCGGLIGRSGGGRLGGDQQRRD